MIGTKIKRYLSTAAVVSLTSATMLVVTAAPASATSVLNYYYCSRLTSLCQQQNPPHSNLVGNRCHWVGTAYTTGSPVSICNYWDN